MTPIYEYRCDCGCTTAKMRKMDERDNICNCENCGKPAKRVASLGSFKIKGGSFRNGYNTAKGAVESNKQFNGGR